VRFCLDKVSTVFCINEHDYNFFLFLREMAIVGSVLIREMAIIGSVLKREMAIGGSVLIRGVLL
jgi:hypothetical protein